MRPSHLALLALAATACFAGAAQAQSCGTLTRAFALDLIPLPNDNRYAVPVMVNNQPRRFLLDTGGAYTQVSMPTISEQGLKPQSGRVRMYDAYGNASDAQVVVDLGIGPLFAKSMEAPVDTRMRTVGGILAADVMQNYDIDIDFAAKKLSYFLTNHCDGKVVYWQAPIIASVPFHGWTRGQFHLDVPVKIDGHEVTAVIDSGATGSTLDSATARQLFDLTADTPGAVPLGTMGADSHKVFGWTFKTLEIGGIKISYPRMRVIPDLVGKNVSDDVRADSHIVRNTQGMGFTMLIGMDVLRKLHLYIAAKEGKLYVTPASDLPPDPSPAATTTAAPAQPAGN
jgi:predicted aspartyl protease